MRGGRVYAASTAGQPPAFFFAWIQAVPPTYGKSISLTKKGGTPSLPSIAGARGETGHHRREGLGAEELLRLVGQPA